MDNVIFLVIMSLILLELDSKYLFTALVIVGVVYYAYLQRDKLKTLRFSMEEELNPENPFNNQLPFMDENTSKFKMDVESSQFDESKIKMYLDTNENKDMKELYYKDIFQPLENYFQKNNGYRQFYHNPDREGFTTFLFGDKLPSCKDTASTCFPAYDNRFSRNLM